MTDPANKSPIKTEDLQIAGFTRLAFAQAMCITYGRLSNWLGGYVPWPKYMLDRGRKILASKKIALGAKAKAA